jgi:REP element-mobilizing transposase RayT
MQRRYEYRRKLPHYQPDHKAFFITFSTCKRWILPETVRGIVIETCLAGNRKKFHLYGLVVMPDHVHMVLAPLADANGPIGISEIMQAIKGTSAHRINRALGRRGRVWEEDHLTAYCVAKKASLTRSNTSSRILSGRGWSVIRLNRWSWRETGRDPYAS